MCRCTVLLSGSQLFGYKMKAVTAPSCLAHMSRGKSQKTEKHVGVSCKGDWTYLVSQISDNFVILNLNDAN